MQLSGYNYVHGRAADSGGLAGLCSLINRQRRQIQDRGGLCLLFDNGDTVQGNALAEMCIHHPELPHPMAQAMNYLGYDALGLGNHDLDFGIAALDRFCRECQMPVISSNLSAKGLPLVAPHAILERRLANHPIKIGVLSTMPRQTASWNRHHLEGQAQLEPPLQAVRRAIAALKSGGADLIIALAHCGIARSDKRDIQENQIEDLVAFPAIDAVIAGHSHQRFPAPGFEGRTGIDTQKGTINGRPVAQPAPYGAELAILDLTLGRSAHGWCIYTAKARLEQPTPLARDNPDILKISAPMHNITCGFLAQPVAGSVPAINSFFSTLRPSKVQALLADVRRKAIQPLVRDTDLAQLPLLAATCDYLADGPENYINVENGWIERRHITGMTPFSDQIWVLRLRAAQIQQWLDWGAGLFARPQNGAPLICKDFPLHNFDTLHGLQYEIIPGDAQPARNLRWQGRPLDPDQEFLVATTHYRASGGGGITAFDDRHIVLRTELVLERALTDFLAAGDFSQINDPHPWRLTPRQAACVTYDAPPAALAHLDEIADFRPKRISTTSTGMARLQLQLAPKGAPPYITP